MDPVAVVVRVISPEIAGAVPGHGLAHTGSHAHDIVVRVDLNDIIVAVVSAIVLIGLLDSYGIGVVTPSAEAVAAHIAGADRAAGSGRRRTADRRT